MKTIWIFALTCLCMMSVQAKEKLGMDLGVGVKAGLNFNKVVASEWNNQFSTNPHAGFFAYLNKHRLGVQVEALWTQNTLRTDSTFYGLYHQYYNQLNDSLNKGTFRFNTISIPLLLNLKLTQFLWLQLGPQYAANINVVDKNKLLKSGVNIIQQGNYNLIGGLWFQLGGHNAMMHLNAGIRYISGISSMSNIATITGNKSEWKNQMIQLHVGLSF